MSLSLESVEAVFDTFHFYGLYKTLPEAGDPQWATHHDVDLPREMDVRFIDYPVVIEHCDELAGMLCRLETAGMSAAQEEKLEPLRVAIKMHEIAQLVASGKVTPGENGITPVIYTHTNPDNNKVHVGWRFEPSGIEVGDLVAIDMGTRTPQAGIVTWKHPAMPLQLDQGVVSKGQDAQGSYTDPALIRQYQATYTNAERIEMEKQHAEQAAQSGYLQLVNQVIDAHQHHFDRYGLTYRLEQFRNADGVGNIIGHLVDKDVREDSKDDIKFRLRLFGAASQQEAGGVKVPVYMHEIAADSMACSPGGGWTVMLPNDGLMLRLTGSNTHAIGTIASSMAMDIANIMLEREPALQAAHENANTTRGIRPY
ncbi:hypothetical protein D3C75_750020 [compost metagenome]